MSMAQCSRCKEVMRYNDYVFHTCKNLRPLKDMPTNLLEMMVNGTITEDEAWKMVDKDLEVV